MTTREGEKRARSYKETRILNIAALASGARLNARSPFTLRGLTWKAERVIDFERRILRKLYIYVTSVCLRHYYINSVNSQTIQTVTRLAADLGWCDFETRHLLLCSFSENNEFSEYDEVKLAPRRWQLVH